MILDELLQVGAGSVIINSDFISRYDQKKTFINWAVRSNNLNLVEHILPSASNDPDCQAEILKLYPDGTRFDDLMKKDPRIALHIAATTNNRDSLIAILDRLPEDELFDAVMEKGPNDRTVLHAASGDRDCLIAILDRLPKDKIFEVVMAKDRNYSTVLHSVAKNEALMIVILDRLPNDKVLEAVMAKQFGGTVLHAVAKIPTSLVAILDRLTGGQGLEAVMTKQKGRTVLHTAASIPDCLTAILKLYPEKNRFDAVLEEDSKNNTVLYLAASNPACLIAILNSLPEDHRYKIVQKFPDLFKSDELLSQIKDIMLRKINRVEETIPTAQKSDFDHVKKNINNATTCSELKEQLNELKTLFSYQQQRELKTRYHEHKNSDESDDDSLGNFF